MDVGCSVQASGPSGVPAPITGELIVKNDVEGDFGIIQLGNRFSLAPTELSVRFLNAAVLWDSFTGAPQRANNAPSSC